MTTEIKQSTAHTFLLGPFVDKTDGVTAETGLATAMDNATTGIRLSKNGGNMADRSDSTAPVHDEDGFYTIVLNTTDTNTLGVLKVEYSEVATALPAWETFSVVTANYWDTKYSTDTFDVNVTAMAANVLTAAATNADHIDLIWDELMAGHVTADTSGLVMNDWQDAGRLDAILDIIAADVVNLDGMASLAATDIVSAGAITTLSGAIVNVDLCDLTTTTTTATNLTTNNDKTGYALSTAGVDLIWDETLAGHVTADTTGLLLNEWQDGGRLDLILDARMAEASIDTTGGAVDTVTAVTNDVGITATAVNLIWDEAMTETTGAPAVTASFREGLKWMFALSRNKILQTATLTTLRNDADGADLATSVVADDATTYTRSEWST